MKKITLLSAVLLCVLQAQVVAGNWFYNTKTSAWEKNITPDMLQFNKQTTAGIQSSMVVNGGAANPSPVISSTSLNNLGATNGYWIVTGGQITGSTLATNVTKGFAIPDTALLKNTLRFAAASSTVTDGFKIGVTGYVNMSWYVPTMYNRTGYKFQITDSVYSSLSSTIGMTVYDESSATTQYVNYDNATATPAQPSIGWRTYSYTQGQNNGTFTPFRIKLSLPNTTTLVAYITTPKFLLTSATEPVQRTVSVQTSNEGVVTPLYGNLHDQDVETFSIVPVAGKLIDLVTFNGNTVTPVLVNGVYTYTTPLLTADATLNISYKNDPSTAMLTTNVDSRISISEGKLCVDGLSAGQLVSIFSTSGKLLHQSLTSKSSFSLALPKGNYLLNVGGKVSKISL